MTIERPGEPGGRSGRKDRAPLPYGAIEGQVNVPGMQGGRSWDPFASPSATGATWRARQPAQFRPNRFLAGIMALLSVALVVAIVVVRSAPAAIPLMYGGLLAVAVVVLVEACYGQVRVTTQGITRRSLRGTTTYLREELATPVLHQYVRRSRSGRQKVRRLSIRRRGGRYGFMITSDLYTYSDLDQIAHLVGAARPNSKRGVEIEQQYPGATRWVHRHPVLFAVLVWAITSLAVGVYAMWLIP